MCLCAVALHLGIVSLWPEWWGGWSWGSRLVTETLPFLALLLLFPLETVLKTRSGTAAVAMTLVVSFAMHVPGVYLGSVDWMKESGKSKEFIEARLWDWTDPPFLFPFRDFRGETPRSSQ